MMRQMLLWVLLTVVLVNECCCDGYWEEERIGLLNIKAWITGGSSRPGSELQDWLENDYCEWSGVSCGMTKSNTQRVTGIDLYFARDSSLGDLYLNASLFLPFKELTSLSLSGSKLVGCFENQGFEILSSSLTKLELLGLSDNKFNDSMLSSLGGFSSLKSLDLSGNILKGSIGIKGFEVLSSNLTRLKELDLSYNKFNDSMLSSLSGFSSLKSLDLSGNILKGSIGIKGLRMLEELHLVNVNMTRNILLQSLGALPSLKSLSVGLNNLDFAIINKGLSGLAKLEVLSLDYSSLPTNFLQSIGPLSSLKRLSLYKCNLNGTTMPTQGSYGLVKLEKLSLDSSSLPTNFLQSIGSLSSLKSLFLLGCNLNGTTQASSLQTIRSSFGLQVLSLTNCKLNGTILAQGFCDLKNLEELYLRWNNLEGFLPACLGNLTSLRVLDVSDNQFIGSIASGPLTNLTSLESLSIASNHFELPASFKPFMNHSNLKYIDCSDNKLIAAEPVASFQNFFPKLQLEYFYLSNCTSQALNAEIPNFLSSQHHLRILDLSHNGFRGMFPSCLFANNTGLEEIYLDHNSFAGTFLLPFHPNVNLTVLEASNNNIHGQIPTNTCLIFPKMEALVMTNNRLIGSIPSCLGIMSYLNYLDLSNNQLSVIQFELLSPSVSNSSTIPQLSVFDISNNHFFGWIGNLTLLAEIDLSNNQFEGPIPQDFCKLQNLKFLDLSENNLSGFIPSCFSSPYLSHVLLNKNRFSGPLTPLFYSNSSLVTLDLAYNNFVGSIPNSIGNLSMLSVLVLKANHFRGELPVQLCMLKQLSILDLSQNELSGPLPSCFSNLTFNASSGKLFYSPDFNTSVDRYMDNIKDQDVEFTTKSQYYTYKGEILDFMSGIDLSCNKFTGEIPPEIGYLSEILALNLSYNNLTGPIPATFINLTQIESLDISHNNLTGAIPPQLTQLTTLEVFSVAYNNLSGKTPERKNQFGTFDADCYRGNPLLCGPPLLNSCSEVESPPQPLPNDSNDDREEDGFMDMEVFYVTFGVCYLIVVLTIAAVLCINPYWRRRWFYFIECCINSCYYFVLDRWFSCIVQLRMAVGYYECFLLL